VPGGMSFAPTTTRTRRAAMVTSRSRVASEEQRVALGVPHRSTRGALAEGAVGEGQPVSTCFLTRGAVMGATVATGIMAGQAPEGGQVRTEAHLLATHTRPTRAQVGAVGAREASVAGAEALEATEVRETTASSGSSGQLTGPNRAPTFWNLARPIPDPCPHFSTQQADPYLPL
jgi:hypothetical protein